MSTQNQQKQMPKLKLTLKKETLRQLTDTEITLLDGVVGGTDGGGGCVRTIIVTVE